MSVNRMKGKRSNRSMATKRKGIGASTVVRIALVIILVAIIIAALRSLLEKVFA